MGTVKQNRLASFDKDLLDIERFADSIGFDIDNLAEWQALNAIVVAYHMGERKYSKSLMVEYGIVRHSVIVHLGGVIV